ncbi:MAG: hypothetical protein MJ212_02120 [Alphaproteobacteria bacterium]|nr:hypothetical protein [Alphaproteobacteria bacterium]
MKKICMLSVIAFLSQLFIATPLKAQTSDAEKMSEILSVAFGAVVKVDITDETCQIVYPKVEIEEILLNDAENNNQEQQSSQVVKTTIPETLVECTKVEDFDGKTQYKIANASPNVLIAKFYNFSRLAFVKNLDVKQFNEEFFVVPELGLVRANKLHISDASYLQKDDTTGLKNELGNLKDVSLAREVSKDGDKIKYKTEAELDSLNIALPIVSMHIGSEKQVAEVEYKQPSEEGEFNYQNLLQNLQYAVLAKSSMVAHDIKMNMDMLGFGLTLDLKTQNRSEAQEGGSFDWVGSTIIDKMVFAGDMIAKNKQPQSVIMKYSLKGIQGKDIQKLSEIQNVELENDNENYDAELAKILDEVSETVTLVTNIKVKFAQGDVVGKLAARKKNGYLQGGLKVQVTNLFAVFPEFKECRNNPNVAQIPECVLMPMYEGLGDFIDITKDNSEVIIKFNEHGVFKDGKKIGDPIELNFQKMQREQEIRQQENEEKLKQMMQEQQSQEAQMMSGQ